jgi:CRP-like cAMP-binding protein
MTQSAAGNRAELAPLDTVGWLAEQPAEFRDWAGRTGRSRRLEGGQVLYDAGEAPDGLYGLAEGALNVTLPLVGDEPVTVHRAEVGFWIGDSALLADAPRLVSLSAALPSRVFFVPAGAVRSLLLHRPEFWPAFYQLSHTNVLTALQLLAEALALSPRARVARHLLRLADGDGVASVSQDDLARLIGVTRTTLYRVVRDLTERGILEAGYRHITILDRAALQRAVEAD